MLLGLSAALLAALVFGVAAVVQAVAVRRHGLISWLMGAVLIAYLAGWLLHLIAIDLLPLYLAQVGVGASLAVTAVVAARVIREPLGAGHWVAVVGMTGGLAALALASGDLGGGGLGAGATAALYLALIANAALGWAAHRWRHPASGPALGVLAGVAYAGSPVATRVLTDIDLDAAALLPAAAIGLYGALGFVLYSAAMARASVTAATAPLILLQTAGPAAIGLAFFGDQVRAGWQPVAALAFAVALASGVVLSGARARVDLIEAGAGQGDLPSPPGSLLG